MSERTSKETPSPTRGKSEARVPVGVERVLYMAALDPAFRAALLSGREAALAGRGFELTESERAMLRLAPDAQLEEAIAAIDTSPTNLERRGFMAAVAATAALATAEVLTSCGGVRSDEPQRDTGRKDVKVQVDERMAGGVRPYDIGNPADAKVPTEGPKKD